MPKLDTNQSPYFNDFDESKNYHQILFKPSLAVQARELSQLQDILQNQVDRFGKHIFEEGSVVSGMEHSIDLELNYVKVTDSLNGITTISGWKGKKVQVIATGVQAEVVDTADGSIGNPDGEKTLFIRYTNTGTDGLDNFFRDTDKIEEIGTSANFVTVIGSTNVADPANPVANSSGTGLGSRVTIGDGIFFVRNSFILSAKQSIILERYSNTPTKQVGYTIDENIVTTGNDSTLFDPAQGAPNFNAPGADRLKISLTLVSRDITNNNLDNFIELFNIEKGTVDRIFDRPEYADLRDEIARRTFDESGHYSVNPFLIKIREHLDDGNNNGKLILSLGGDKNKLVAGIEPGKAFIKGFEYETVKTEYLNIDKGTDVQEIKQQTVPAAYGNYVLCDEIVGPWDIDGLSKVELRTAPAGTKATGTYTIVDTNNAANNETITIGTVTYTFKTTLSTSPTIPNEILIGATDDATILNLVRSITLTGTIGTDYSTGTIIHPTVTAVVGSPDNSIDITAKLEGKVGNSIITTEVTAQGSWGAITLTGALNGAISTTSFGTQAAGGSIIGNARIRAVIHETGVPGISGTTFRLYLFDISFNSSNVSFFDIRGIFVAGTPNSSASTILDTKNNASLKETSFHKMIFPIPQENVKRIRDSLGVINTKFRFTEEFSSNFNSSGVATITLTESNVAFIGTGAQSATEKLLNFYVVLTSAGGSFSTGEVLDMDASGRSISISGNVVTLNLGEATAVNATTIVVLDKSSAREMSKALATTTTVLNPNTHPNGILGSWNLGKNDGFKLNTVHMSADFATAATTSDTNITSNFDFDNGQKDNCYEQVSIQLKQGSTFSITGQFLVTYQHFTHSSSQGIGYFSVDSYPIDDTGVLANTIKTFEIPEFISPLTGKTFVLRDSFDFRPSKTDTSGTNPADGSTTDFIFPVDGNHVPLPNSNIDSDFEFFLSRIDKITINSDGVFGIVKGVPALRALQPNNLENAMVIGIVKIPPFPSLAPNIAKLNNRRGVQLKLVANKRYTMSNIGELENRINRLEYYTSLSLLEKDTDSLIIQDSAGLDRFKNGILVDPFTGHNVGDVSNFDYACSIDMIKHELRPKFKLEHVNLKFDSANSTNVVTSPKDLTIILSGITGNFTKNEIITGATNNGTAIINHWNSTANKLYVSSVIGIFTNSEAITGGTSGATASVSGTPAKPKEGDLVSIAYTHSVFAEQPFSSKSRNAVSELIFNWVGELELNPDSDNWVDTKNAPDVEINFDNNMDAWEKIADAWGTQWNDWETLWEGTEEVSRDIVGGQIRLQGNRGEQVFQSQSERITTLTTQQQSRSGIQLRVTPETITRNIGSKVTDISIIPFMREKVIDCHASRMKPNTLCFIFFDGEDVGNFITHTDSNFAQLQAEGDSISNASLKTDSNGDLYFKFRIPNSDSLRFRVGSKTLRVCDSADNSNFVSTAANAIYSASGLLKTSADTIISTREARIQSNTILESRTVESESNIVNQLGERFVGQVANQEISYVTNELTTEGLVRCVKNKSLGGPAWACWGAKETHCQTIVNGKWTDPLSQSFFIDTKGGIFLSKIDLYFKTKSSTLPITLQIRNMVNGVPGTKIIPFGQVTLSASDINISSTAKDATLFQFTSPVYLQNNTEYCFVLLPAGNNPDYELWVGELGQNNTGTTNRISAQPAIGVLFTSANNRTWTAHQNEDIKFTLYNALFDKTLSAKVLFKNDPVDLFDIETFAGGNNGNFKVGEIVTGGTSGATGTVKEFDRQKGTITVVNNSVTAFVAEAITGGTTTATANITTIKNIQLNVLEPTIDSLNLHATNIDWKVKNTNTSNTLDTTFTKIINEENNFLVGEKRVVSRSNEISLMSSNSSLQYEGTMITIDNNNSPVIDLSRIGSILVGNIINNLSSTETDSKGGNATARYITRRVILDEDMDAEDIQVFLTAKKPAGSNIEVYYKILNGTDDTAFDDRKYVKMDQITDSFLTSSTDQNIDDFKEFQYGISSTNLTGPNKEVQYNGVGNKAEQIFNITASVDIADGEFIRINGTSGGTENIIYTLKTSLTPTAGEVLIGASITDTLSNIIDAINNNSATAGTKFVVPTLGAHNDVTAIKIDANNLKIISKKDGTNPNAIATTASDTNGNVWGAATLTGGTSGPIFTGFKNMAIKIVMLSPTTDIVPIIKDMRTIALSI